MWYKPSVTAISPFLKDIGKMCLMQGGSRRQSKHLWHISNFKSSTKVILFCGCHLTDWCLSTQSLQIKAFQQVWKYSICIWFIKPVPALPPHYARCHSTNESILIKRKCVFSAMSEAARVRVAVCLLTSFMRYRNGYRERGGVCLCVFRER